MGRRHGDLQYFLVRDELLLFTSNVRETIRIPVTDDLGEKLAEHGISTARVGKHGERLFPFDFMFRGLQRHKTDPNHLIELGKEMTLTAGDESASNLPAGYTFLGQFIDHDITFNANLELVLGDQPVILKSKRSPSLDLDSVYGFEPEKIMGTDLGNSIYDGAKLKVGVTDKVTSNLPSTDRAYFHDLPRRDKSALAALIDERNDENLAVAQTHLAFIKFHNAIVDTLPKDDSPEKLFREARKIVVRHYQRVILDDFLPELLHPRVVEEMQNGGPTHFHLGSSKELFIPLEFAVAAFRIGHSLVRSQYEWNGVFQSTNPQPQAASLEDLFVFTGNQGLKNRWHLTSDWIIDWTRFFNFSGFPVKTNEPVSKAGKIDAVIAGRLGRLDPIPDEVDETRFLAVRNLLRGLDVGLPTGQDVAKHLGYPLLRQTDFSDLPYHETLRKFGFDKFTPLWLYILHEAKIHSKGEQLGLVGSRIVAETILTLLQASETKILPPETKWKTPQEETKFGMANLLMLVNDASEKKDFLNPLG